jgi:ornithine carbamoyltransferase
LALVFEKPSLRTRVSFEIAMSQLGGTCVVLGPDEVGLGTREPVEDVAGVLSRYVDILAARVFAHQDVVALAEHATVPVINALSDIEHPCQTLADLLTLKERFGKLEGLTLAYIGDGNNVARSLAFGCAMTGVNFRISSPRGYELDPQPFTMVSKATPGWSLHQIDDPMEVAAGADVVYTDVWTSMGQESERNERLRAFAGYQVTLETLGFAARDAIFLHDMPAHRGEEVADGVMEDHRSAVLDQAENRLHTQRALLAFLLGASDLPH